MEYRSAPPFEVKSSVKFNITTLRGIWAFEVCNFWEEFEMNVLEDHSFNVNGAEI